jgi:hypothetical protein
VGIDAKDQFVPQPDETIRPGERMTEVLAASDLRPGDVIRIWTDSLPYTFGEKGWLPGWWWSRVVTVTDKGVHIKDLKSGNEGERSFADTIRNAYGIRSYKHPRPDRF